MEQICEGHNSAISAEENGTMLIFINSVMTTLTGEQPVRVFAPQEHTVDQAEPSVVERHDTSVETRSVFANHVVDALVA
jgi:hypothetical protein